MKKFLLIIVSFLSCCTIYAEALEQTFYFDFGSVISTAGDNTTGADVNGHYWNNITNNSTANKYAAAGTIYSGLVNSANTTTKCAIKLNSRFSTNGKAGGGGLLTPTVENLADLAVVTATEDYFFIESGEDNSNFTLSGLDPQKGYKFYVFASRKATDNRTGYYTMAGINQFKGELQLAGTDLGGTGINQNIKNILVSDLVYPDDSGNITFTVSRKSGAYIALNAMKMEEYSGGTRPSETEMFSSLTLSGTGAEGGIDAPMHMVSATGKLTNSFELYTNLQSGTLTLKGVTTDGKSVAFGMGSSAGALEKDGAAITSPGGLMYITVDLTAKTFNAVPIASMKVLGSVVNGWTVTTGMPLDYQGNGVWKSKLELSRVSTVSDPERFIFVMNDTWDYQIKRKAGTADSVGLASQGWKLEDIRLNHGTYIITLDLRNYIYKIESDQPIDGNRISVMGSSVANGQGATDNHGYAYMLGELLQKRSNDNISTNPFYTSEISVNGNNTVKVLARYNDLIHEFGKYVIYGLSLGNEGIHEAADTEKQAVFDQFKANMLTLISKARADGKYPVVMNNYARGDFNALDYSYIKKMNLLIHEWDVPSVNMLGALDNGSGVWASGYQDTSDNTPYHPNTAGHRELYHAIVPSLFDAIAAGKAQPVRNSTGAYALANKHSLVFTPEDTIHSFTIVANVRGTSAGTIASFANVSASGTISSTSTGEVLYTSPIGTANIAGKNKINDGNWHSVALTHYYASGRTLLYVDAQLEGELSEQLSAGKFSLGDAGNTISRDYREIFFYRSGMTGDEISALYAGKMLKSSLEIYAPLTGNDLGNLAQSTNILSIEDNSGVSLSPIDSVKIIGEKGYIRIISEKPVSVVIYAIDGKMVFRARVAGDKSIAMEKGLYIANGTKILVE